MSERAWDAIEAMVADRNSKLKATFDQVAEDFAAHREARASAVAVDPILLCEAADALRASYYAAAELPSSLRARIILVLNKLEAAIGHAPTGPIA